MKLLIIMLATLSLVACKSGSGSSSGGTSTGGGTSSGPIIISPTYTHSDLATDFVDALNYDLDYDVELVKTYTLQTDFIVVYDYDLDSYDAYDLSGYTYGEDIGYYLEDYEYSFYYDLDDIGGNYYEDYITGIQFSKAKMTPSDSAKAQELIDGIKVKKATEQLTVQFGLAPKRAKEIAGLAMQLSTADKSKMTVYQYDQYSKAILGSTFNEVKTALEDKLSGNNKSLDKVFSKAAKTNGISKNSVSKLADLFIKN